VRGKRESKRETRDEKRAENERSEKTFAFCSKSSKIGLESGTQNQKINSLSLFISPNKIKKNKHTSKGKNSISPPPLQKFIYTHRIKKTAYIKNGFYCASEKSLLVSHFLVRCDRIERSRVFARGGFPIGFFLLSFFTRRDGLELSLPA
jgi:hypothetical protein